MTLHPNDCQSFIICISGQRKVNRCADNLLFDPVNLRCDRAENVMCIEDGGGGSPQPPDVDYMCDPNREFYFAPHPNSCSHYFVCVYGNRRLAECANGLIFDWIDLRCDTPENGFCLAPRVA